MKIALVFQRTYEQTVGTYFDAAFRALGIDVDRFNVTDADRIPAMYDLYVRIDDEMSERTLPKHLRPQIRFAIDLHLPHVRKHLWKTARQYDLVLVTVRWEMDRLKKKGIPVEWFHFGCDPDIHARYDLPKLYDIGFVGRDGGNPRKFVLEILRERYPNHFIGQAYFKDIGKIYSQSKIGFNYAIKGECFQMRSYEVLACGAMLLMHKLRDDSVERLDFVDGEDLVLCDSMSDLLEKMNFYLAHDKERIRIAESGYKKVRAHHTYRHRVCQLLELVRERIGLSVHIPDVSGYQRYSLKLC